ncbi:MAG: reverse transcriptase domain-containing protein [Candidatus Thiodiazotropha endolucinida]|nr:reverse transcriptase domain-containing protein [Candidatus Thiodiazotropha endolucinida]
MGDGHCISDSHNPDCNSDQDKVDAKSSPSQSHSENKRLNFLSINVCGLISKLNCPEFISLVNNYDIIGLQETKLDDIDTIEIPGYTAFFNNRSCSSRNRSGGIALLIKDAIVPYIKVHANISELILSFTIQHAVHRDANTNEDLICGVVYIPPYGSKYAAEDPFLEIQEVLLKHSGTVNNILLFGDFNSRTGTLPDYVHMDNFICTKLGIEDLSDENTCILNFFDISDIPLIRQNADNSINTYGRNLIDFCKSNNIFILNGRLSNDRFAPKLTCKDSSTVDYFISSACIFEQISEFEIHEFSNLYSDAHCSLKLSLNISLAVNDSSKITEVPDLTESPKLWDASKADLFVENFDIPRVAEIETMLFRLQDKHPSAICKDDIDSIINDIGSLFIHCSKDTFGYKKQKPESRYSKFKPWFNRECINARNLYHKVRKTYNQHKNEYYKNMLKNVSKKYKNTLKLHSDKYKIERIQKLRNLKSNNPKEYWRVINSEKKKNNVTAPLNDFYEFYKQINSGANSENEDDGDTDINDFLQNCNFDNEFQTILENEINQKISANEISTAIKSLRNNKSPGIDNIVNEHLKTTVNIMLPIYVKLFNIIFDTGIIPECWTLGTIKPIYKDKGNIREPGNYRPITLLSCFGKVFTAIINNRLNKFSDKHGLIHWEQAGFRKNFSTTDNLFVLKSLIDFVQRKKKKLYCCFIDFQQAFDTVWRAGLWRKLIQTGIMGKCFNLIFNMYKDIKSKVVTNEGSSSFFECNVGVRQGENLSPFLFSIYLNDLENFLRCNKASGVDCEVKAKIHLYI